MHSVTFGILYLGYFMFCVHVYRDAFRPTSLCLYKIKKKVDRSLNLVKIHSICVAVGCYSVTQLDAAGKVYFHRCR